MKTIILLAFALLPLGAAAQTIYKWTDSKGVTHYSENPPPDVKATKSGIRSDKPASTAVTAAAKSNKAAEDKIKAQRAAACRSALAQYTLAQSQPRTYTTNAKGEHAFSSDGSIEARTHAAQTLMRKNCSE